MTRARWRYLRELVKRYCERHPVLTAEQERDTEWLRAKLRALYRAR
jgi:hypothetical protein